MANKVKITVCGSNYIVSSPDPEDYVLNLADRINLDMNEILASSPNASVTSAAVLAALGYLDDLEKATGSADNMRSQIKDYLSDAARSKMSAEDARREATRLKAEVKSLKEKLARCEKDKEKA